MAKIVWDFPPRGSGNEQGYTNGGIEMFKGMEDIENLTREICQNSLDAHDPNTNLPVRVEFSLLEIDKTRHPVFSEYARCIDGCKRYWGQRMDKRLREFVDRAEKVLAKDKIPVLVASDYNTKGLTGAKANPDEESVWRALAHSDGTSVNKSNDSGGSYGVGKNAPFALSDLSVVFYNTFAEDGIHAFQGAARLATIIDENGVSTQGVGHYLVVEDNGEWHPIFEDNDCLLRDAFSRTEHGTDIIIFGFTRSHWEDAMRQAVLSNFFLAIHEGRMVVKIAGKEINAQNLGDEIEKYRAENAEMRNTSEWYQALTDPDEGQVRHTSILGSGEDVDLYIKAGKEYSNYVACFRSTGMRIRKYRKAIMQHFSAVMVVRGSELNALLRETEPAKHNRWDHTNIENDKKRRAIAKKAIADIDKWVLDELLKRYDTVTQLSIDSGEGEYLPDDTDTMSQTQNGDDNLRVNQKISEVSVTRRTYSSKQVGTVDDKGTVIQDVKKKRQERKPSEPSGDPRIPGGEPKPGVERPPKVIPPGETPGKNPDVPGRRVSMVSIIDQRAFAINPNLGLYKAFLTSDRDYKKAYVTFSAVREDERTDPLVVEKYSIGGHTTKGDGATIGPFALKKDTPCEIVITFSNKEKMRLDMVTTEVKS